MTATHKTENNIAAVSVWPTAQAAPATQRTGRYHPDSVKHPAKMLPAIAAHAIEAYTHPGDLVLDPMCGIGTTLVEALHRGRRAIGVEYETRWADLARTNIDLAYGAGIDLDAAVYQGDARKLPTLLPADLRGQVDLVITSPPYGDSTHGHVRVKPGEGVRKYDHRYGAVLDRGNLANVGIGRLLTGFTRILTGVADYLKPGGHVVITARPWRQHAELIDLPTHITTCGTLAGLTPVERCVALLGRLADDDIIARSSFFQRDFIVKNRRGGLPVHLIAHEDVIVLERRDVPDSLQLKQTHPNRSLVSTAAWVDRKWAA
ncbi:MULTISPECIES: TRM11 family SAM-dependent methyltransferase [Nocardia]|uniref:Methyltransferase n=4 Tax=Nocardia TaxID=1817 RepID=A0A7G1KFQ6_9NOCA|nr:MULTISPECIES: DNA methyltransferase [Nocardia]MBF6259802.1 site-specific DNA-methyltransferase [Nocardia farcinica]MBF6271358.1 site-specific DNA-methyltransferase [Nocardia farcinica]MBF6295425.1 site-specific DNA-methyltransferase [Nocardia farcinica]MBF6362320.1 site-specific DNA-methyltransferase [Nocardia farcinica]MBF6376613.1 site-specific DNA-methyltransferase [Nocardia farcinica]